jgi:hypothetical protein
MYRSVVKILVGVVGISLMAVLGACGPAAATQEVFNRVGEATLKAGDAIPAPNDEVVVTITGNIGTGNAGESIQMDMSAIESVGLVDLNVTDPFEGNKTTFRGVLMCDLLGVWGVPADATTLHMVALNDYSVDVPIKDLREYPVVFAVMQDGEYMPVTTRGPAMLVYPYDNFEFDQSVYNNYWIWQIKSIEVQ